MTKSNAAIDLRTFRTPARRARRERKRRAGMTLVEIMIVVIIMALIATAVGVAVVPQMQRARINQTLSDAQAVASAAQLFLAQDPGADCPTVADLVEARYLERGRRTTDAWDHEFTIQCDDGSVCVISGGPTEQDGDEINSCERD